MTIDRRKLIRIAGAVIAASALCAALYASFESGVIRLNHPSPARFPIRGIDVSHHQNVIDWDRVASGSDIRFAYIKATEGGDFRDPRFSENWRNAKRAGLVRGAYHFFTFCRPGRDQAVNLLETVPQEPDTLPFAIDLEFGGNCSVEPTLDTLLSELNDFLDETRKVDPRKPVFYVTPEFFDRYMRDNLQRFPEHCLWLRNIYYEPAQKRCERWQFWQFANRGRIDGIEGAVDLNLFCAGQEEFSKLLDRSSQKAILP